MDYRKLLCNSLSILQMLVLCLLQLKKRKVDRSSNLLGIGHFTADFMEELLKLLKLHFGDILFVKFGYFMQNQVLWYEERNCIYLPWETNTGLRCVLDKEIAFFEVWTLKFCPYMHFSMSHSEMEKPLVFMDPVLW